MKTLIATTLLTAALLSAGAFANNVKGRPDARLTNVTVILKNQVWPIKSQMSVEPCRLTRCLDV